MATAPSALFPWLNRDSVKSLRHLSPSVAPKRNVLAVDLTVSPAYADEKSRIFSCLSNLNVFGQYLFRMRLLESLKMGWSATTRECTRRARTPMVGLTAANDGVERSVGRGDRGS